MYSNKLDGALNQAWYESLLNTGVDLYSKYDAYAQARRAREEADRRRQEIERANALAAKVQATGAGPGAFDMGGISSMVMNNWPVLAVGGVGVVLLMKMRGR